MATVTVHALSSGFLTLPERFFVTSSDPEAIKPVPSMSFLVQHTSGKTIRIIFDLGIKKNITRYSPKVQTHIKIHIPFGIESDVVASLAEGGLKPTDIDYVILSHITGTTLACHQISLILISLWGMEQ